jgi:hypothetical protein
MHIKIEITYDDQGMEAQTMYIDGKEIVCVSPLNQSPEDAYLERALIGPTDVIDYMEVAYNAGKNGDGFSYEVIDDSKEDENE